MNRLENTTAVNMIGAVSPAARPSDRTAPVMIPEAAAGRTTRRIVCERAAPRPKDASRSDCGTALRASSVVLIIVGRIIKARQIIPASRLIPHPRKSTRNANPNTPKTIEGVPESRSMPVRRREVMREFPAYSFRYTAAPIPIGRAIRIAPNTSSSVPIIAGKIPPALPKSFGDSVRNSQVTAGIPFMKILPRITARTARTANVPR